MSRLTFAMQVTSRKSPDKSPQWRSTASKKRRIDAVSELKKFVHDLRLGVPNLFRYILVLVHLPTHVLASLNVHEEGTLKRGPTNRYAVYALRLRVKALAYTSVSVVTSQVEEIEACALQGCVELTTVKAARAKRVGPSALKDCPKLERISMANVRRIGPMAFCKCRSLDADLSRVTHIGEHAFHGSGTTTLVSCVLEELGAHAFEGAALIEVDLRRSDVVLGSGAFYRCGRLEGAHLTLPSLPSSTFAHCDKLTDVTLGLALSQIGRFAFYASGITEIKCNVSEVNEGVFSKCANLQSVELPNAVRIEKEAFAGCKSLTHIKTGDLESIGERAFEHCNALAVHTLPGSHQEWLDPFLEYKDGAWVYCRLIHWKK